MSLSRYDEIFEQVKNWGRWGPHDRLGTLNFITPSMVNAAAGLVRSGRAISMALPINKLASRDNPDPAIHLLTLGHDLVRPGRVSFAADYLGIAFHGDAHTHLDALCHVAYKGFTYNGRLATDVVTSRLATELDIAGYRNGLVGRGVLLDIPRYRGVKWLEPGDAVSRTEIEAVEAAQGVHLGEGDILVFRTGRHRRRLEGAQLAGPAGKAGLDVDAIPWIHERRIAAFLPDGDGETIPSGVEELCCPIHPLQIAAMGMLAADNLQLEELAQACADEGRFDFMVVGAPLPLPGGTGSPWNPIAIL